MCRLRSWSEGSSRLGARNLRRQPWSDPQVQQNRRLRQKVYVPQRKVRLEQIVGEIVTGTLRVPGVQLHRALGAGILTGAAGDHHHRVADVQEWTFDCYLPILQDEGPKAFPAFSRDNAYAVPLISTQLRFIGSIKNRVGKR